MRKCTYATWDISLQKMVKCDADTGNNYFFCDKHFKIVSKLNAGSFENNTEGGFHRSVSTLTLESR